MNICSIRSYFILYKILKWCSEFKLRFTEPREWSSKDGVSIVGAWHQLPVFCRPSQFRGRPGNLFSPFHVVHINNIYPHLSTPHQQKSLKDYNQSFSTPLLYSLLHKLRLRISAIMSQPDKSFMGMPVSAAILLQFPNLHLNAAAIHPNRVHFISTPSP